ncbi:MULTISPECIES: TIGR03086 family metal-binding protein [unclassified Isoptericola]|uniref:TIGR03086 family metal-binding protein n=1 Tax=unclassified Isoptericola TaxID=2623355 RepID=UPI003651BC62
MDTSALHTATEAFAALVSEVTPGDLAAPTPCEGWDVADLYRHVVTENVHFGQAVAGTEGAPSDLEQPPGLDRVGPAWPGLETTYRRTAGLMERAFADVTDPEQRRPVPGVRGERAVADLYEMQLCDTVIHTWDLARALGLEDDDVDPALAQRVLRRMQAGPDTSRGPGRAFAEVRGAARPGAGVLEQIILLSGRTP